jgi:hypothetical protein
MDEEFKRDPSCKSCGIDLSKVDILEVFTTRCHPEEWAEWEAWLTKSNINSFQCTYLNACPKCKHILYIAYEEAESTRA